MCRSTFTLNVWKMEKLWLCFLHRTEHFSIYLISFKRILIQKSWEVNLTGAHEQQVKATVTTSSSSAGSPTWVCLSLTAFTTAALQHMAVLPLMLWHCLHLGPATSLPSWACSWNLQHFGCLHYLHFTGALPVWHSHQVLFQRSCKQTAPPLTLDPNSNSKF